MIKLVGLVGSNAKHSYNRMLLQWIKKNYQQQFHLEIIELATFPLFSHLNIQYKCTIKTHKIF